MPQVQNRFAGHVESGDPRSLLFAAAGCVWPTMPAFRYRAQSTTATGEFLQLNGDGILLLNVPGGTTHDTGEWGSAPLGGAIEYVILTKVQEEIDGTGFRWILEIKLATLCCPEFRPLVRSAERCNQDIHYGNLLPPPEVEGDAGEDFSINQVVYDQTLPPDYDA